MRRLSFTFGLLLSLQRYDEVLGSSMKKAANSLRRSLGRSIGRSLRSLRSRTRSKAQAVEPEPDTCAASYTINSTAGPNSYYLQLTSDRTRIEMFQFGTYDALPIEENPNVVIIDPQPEGCLQAFESILKMGVHIGEHRTASTANCEMKRLISPEVAMKRLEAIRSTPYNNRFMLFDLSEHDSLCPIIEDLYKEVEEVLAGKRAVVRSFPPRQCVLHGTGDAGDFHLVLDPNEGRLLSFRKDSTMIVPSLVSEEAGRASTVIRGASELTKNGKLRSCEDALNEYIINGTQYSLSPKGSTMRWLCGDAEKTALNGKHPTMVVSTEKARKGQTSTQFRAHKCALAALGFAFENMHGKETAIDLREGLDTETCEFNYKVTGPPDNLKGPLRLGYYPGSINMISDGRMRLLFKRSFTPTVDVRDELDRVISMPYIKDCPTAIATLLRIGYLRHRAKDEPVVPDHGQRMLATLTAMRTTPDGSHAVDDKALDIQILQDIHKCILSLYSLFAEKAVANPSRADSMDEDTQCSLHKMVNTSPAGVILHLDIAQNNQAFLAVSILSRHKPPSRINIPLSSVIPNLSSHISSTSATTKAGSCEYKLATILAASWNYLVESMPEPRRRQLLFDELRGFAHQQLANEARNDWARLDWKARRPTAFQSLASDLTTDVIFGLAQRLNRNEDYLQELGKMSAMNLARDPRNPRCELRMKDSEGGYRVGLDRSFRLAFVGLEGSVMVNVDKIEQDLKSVGWYSRWDTSSLPGRTASQSSSEASEDLMGHGTPSGKNTAELCKLAFVYYLETTRLLPAAAKYINELPRGSPGFINLEGIIEREAGRYYVAASSALGRLLTVLGEVAKEMLADEDGDYAIPRPSSWVGEG
ncbi:hypothetical protein FOZ60_009413 [Perkinsus olseni]|uniref:Uncharacterized protein n=1 Tax=Perkinsus olseni TaxID=32597 RepID=A0A7J6PCQ7_PEROL|nr:hypothetical protein FOZ60_009413 [Perkinsus olseni]